jgi:hypothetical protein
VGEALEVLEESGWRGYWDVVVDIVRLFCDVAAVEMASVSGGIG